MSIPEITTIEAPHTYSIDREQLSPEQSVILSLFEAIEKGDAEAFVKILQTVDLNTYCDCEGADTLLSALLLGFLINPEIAEGESFINKILEQNPNLDLPAIRDGSSSFKDTLNQAREALPEALDSQALEIALSRIDLIVNTYRILPYPEW